MTKICLAVLLTCFFTGMFYYIGSEPVKKKYQESLRQRTKLQEVVVAAKDIEAGQKITLDDVKVGMEPKSHITPPWQTISAPEQVVGLAPKTAIPKGEQLTVYSFERGKVKPAP